MVTAIEVKKTDRTAGNDTLCSTPVNSFCSSSHKHGAVTCQHRPEPAPCSSTDKATASALQGAPIKKQSPMKNSVSPEQ